jgi:hypothetical protein
MNVNSWEAFNTQMIQDKNLFYQQFLAFEEIKENIPYVV